MTIPTGLGLTQGRDAAGQAGTPLPRRTARAAANDARYGDLGNIPDPCFCGCCDMEKRCC